MDIKYLMIVLLSLLTGLGFAFFLESSEFPIRIVGGVIIIFCMAGWIKFAIYLNEKS